MTPQASNCGTRPSDGVDPDLGALLERVEAATGPDRELDALIHMATTDYSHWSLGETNPLIIDLMPRAPGWLSIKQGSVYRSDGPVSEFTASLDAALALVERHRDGLDCYGWQVELDDEPVHHPYYARIAVSTRSPAYGNGQDGGGVFYADGDSPALALLAALIQALISQSRLDAEQSDRTREGK